MKKSLCIVMVASLLLLSACAPQQEDIRTPANFYYCTSPITYDSADGAISAEIRESAPYEDDIPGLIGTYLKGPAGTDHTSPFPANVSVISYTQADSIVDILLSRQFARLTGFDLTVACACLTLTITELTQADTVVIRANNASLDGKQFVVMRADDLVFWDTAAQAGGTN